LTILSMGPWFLMLHLSRRCLLLKPVEYQPTVMGAIQNALMEQQEKLNNNNNNIAFCPKQQEKLNTNRMFIVNRNRANNRWDITCP
jgi:hypothetical protein